MSRIYVLCICSAMFLFSACDQSAEPDQPESTDAEDTLGANYRYEIFLQEGISDTLSGPAAFGRVVDAETGYEQFVIELQDPENLTDGLMLVRDERDFQEGSYRVVGQGDDEDGFRVTYRMGMLREFTGSSGEVELTTVSDTLIEGQLDIQMEGWHVLPGESEEEGTIRARGAFRAAEDGVGFIVGL